MKRILLIALLTLTCHAAHAQSFGVTIGGRFELVPDIATRDGSALYVPALGLEYGLEFRTEQLTVGARVALSNFVLLYWHLQADLYVGYKLSDGLMPYAGVGYSIKAPVIGAFSEDLHALLGVRFLSGFFMEVTPGVGFASVCVPSNQPTGPSCSGYTSAQVLLIGLNLGWVLML